MGFYRESASTLWTVSGGKDGSHRSGEFRELLCWRSVGMFCVFVTVTQFLKMPCKFQ